MQVFKSNPENILVLRLSSFGDIVLSEPIVRALKVFFPSANLYFLTLSNFSELPAMFLGVDSIVPVGKETWSSDIEVIKSIRFDLAVDLHNTLRTRAILRKVKPDKVIRYRRERFKRLLCVYMPVLWRGRLKHTVDLYAEPLEKMGIRVDDRIPRITPISDSGLTWDKIKNGKRIGLCPGASSPHKRWSEEKFAELAKRLQDMGYQVLLIGSRDDREQIERCQSTGGYGFEACIGDNLNQVALALCSCKIAVGNDSGMMHFAAALGVKVVVIFGPSSPLLGFAPIVPWSASIYKDLDCSPCSYHGNVACKYGHYNCLELISPEDVAKQVVEIAMEV